MARAKKAAANKVVAEMIAEEVAVEQVIAEATAVPEEAPIRPLTEILAEVEAETITAVLESIATNFTERSAYETLRNPNNESVQDKLKSYSKKMAKPGVAALLAATQVDASFINRSVNEGKRFNIYAIDKFNDLTNALLTSTIHNAVNFAVLKSLFRFAKAEVAFTGAMALAAVSDKVKLNPANAKIVAPLLHRHDVSAATAPTQTSSTMSALAVLGVVTNKGSQKFPIWAVKDSPATRQLQLIAA